MKYPRHRKRQERRIRNTFRLLLKDAATHPIIMDEVKREYPELLRAREKHQARRTAKVKRNADVPQI